MRVFGRAGGVATRSIPLLWLAGGVDSVEEVKKAFATAPHSSKTKLNYTNEIGENNKKQKKTQKKISPKS